MIRIHFLHTIKIFRSNNATEYTDFSFITTLNEVGTVSQRSCPGISQQNSLAERKHHHILDTIQTLLISTNFLEPFWREAALTTVYIIN